MDTQNIQDIQVNIDTNVIEENTADSTQVKIIYERKLVEKEFTTADGKVVKTDGELSVREEETTTLGDIKVTIGKIDTEIARLQAEKAILEEKRTLVEPKVSDGIAERASSPNVTDNRV